MQAVSVPLFIAQELCESRGGRPGHPVPDSPCGHCGRKASLNETVHGAQELCEGRGGCPGPPVPDSPYGHCGRKATLNETVHGAQELCESRGGCPGHPVPDSPCGHCGRKATFEEEEVPPLPAVSKRRVHFLRVRLDCFPPTGELFPS